MVEFEREGVAELDRSCFGPRPGLEDFVQRDSCGNASDFTPLEIRKQPGAVESGDDEDVASLRLGQEAIGVKWYGDHINGYKATSAASFLVWSSGVAGLGEPDGDDAAKQRESVMDGEHIAFAHCEPVPVGSDVGFPMVSGECGETTRDLDAR